MYTCHIPARTAKIIHLSDERVYAAVVGQALKCTPLLRQLRGYDVINILLIVVHLFVR